VPEFEDVYYFEVRWSSHGKMLKVMVDLREDMQDAWK
jgi:hypothetical protein